MRIKTALGLSAAIAGLVAPAFAQAADAAPARAAQTPAQSGEIVVTASRQGATSVQRVPIAITAIAPDTLAAKGKGGLLDIATLAPGLNVQQTTPGINRIDMRGITTGTISVTNIQDRPLVAVYLDDVPLALQSGNPDLRVFDLERIEVLRGPQGTLYGAGSMAGTIRYITVKPDTEALSGSVEGDASVTDHGGLNGSFRGILNLPLTSTLAARFGFYQGHDSGWIDNVGLGVSHANYDDTTQARGAIRWQPTPEFTLDASVTFEKMHAHGRNVGFVNQSRYVYETQVPEGYLDNLKIYNITGAYDLGFGTVSASSSYVVRHTNSLQDYGYTAPLFGLNSFAAQATVQNRLKDFSEEIRFVSKKSDVLNYTFGAYYQNTVRHYYQDVPTRNFDEMFGSLIGDPTFSSQNDYQAFNNNDIFSGLQDVNEHQIAEFGEASLTLGKATFTAGLRHFNFTQNFNLFYSGVAGSLGPGDPLTQTGTETAHGINPRFVASFKPNRDVMIFAEAAKGFRYGGVNQPVPQSFCGAALAQAGLTSAPLTFGPDSLWSYAIGEKGQYFDRKLTFNVDAFYVDWNNVQTNKNLSCSYYFTQNQGKVTSKGLELESRLKVTPAFTIGINASYTDATANGAIPNASAIDGDRVPYFPRYTAAMNADYVVPVGSGKLTLSGDFTSRGGSYTEFSPDNPLRRFIPGSQVVDASATYEQGLYEFGLFATNINNSRRISLVEASLPTDVGDRVYYGTPRTIGIRIKKRF